jgi:signal transduction histidine kinase
MTLSLRVHLFLLMVVVSSFIMAAVVFVTLLLTREYLREVEQVDDRLEAIASLQVYASQYAGRIPELLLPGADSSAFERSRSEFDKILDRLQQRINADEDLDELYRLERLRALRHELDGFIARMVELRGAGRLDEAVAVYRREVSTRLEGAFNNVIMAAVLDERDEVGQAEGRAATLWRNLATAASLVAFLAAGACLLAGAALRRSLLRPLGLLISGTEAMARGDFEHRIRYDAADEFGALATRLNEMTALHQQQRALLLQARKNLEAEVAARTSELGAANQRLVDLDRMRAQFLADISHELRTPLTALRGEAEVTLRHGQGEEVYQATLRKIVNQASELNRLVEDLLFLARTETDTVRFEWRRLVLQDVLGEAASEAEMLARARNIQIEADFPSKPIWIEADPQRFKQALMILLDNAVKYSSPGRSVMLRVRIEGSHAQVSVRDEGMGISAEDLPRVFERYYRGRMSGTPGKGGTGLGLAIAKWLVEKQGGDIAITSEENRFTEVRITMPTLEVRSLAQDSAR